MMMMMMMIKIKIIVTLFFEWFFILFLFIFLIYFYNKNLRRITFIGVRLHISNKNPSFNEINFESSINVLKCL